MVSIVSRLSPTDGSIWMLSKYSGYFIVAIDTLLMFYSALICAKWDVLCVMSLAGLVCWHAKHRLIYDAYTHTSSTHMAETKRKNSIEILLLISPTQKTWTVFDRIIQLILTHTELFSKFIEENVKLLG